MTLRASVATDPHQTRLADLNWRACDFYRRELRNTPSAISYMRRRGVDGATAARYAVGYAPAVWQGLDHEFDDYRTSEDLVAAGLVAEGSRNQRYDRFRDRIMFPIADADGFIVGFGGRSLSGNTPKYLNTGETRIFQKGEVLYGEWQARQSIAQTGEVVVVEGYLDVLAVAQLGAGNAVAPMGTALTTQQAKRLISLAPLLLFAFDGDAAGQDAALRAADAVLPLVDRGSAVGVITLPEGEDPDSLLRSDRASQWQERLNAPVALIPYLLDVASQRFPGSHPEATAGRGQFLAERLALIADERTKCDATAFVAAALGMRSQVMLEHVDSLLRRGAERRYQGVRHGGHVIDRAA